MKPFILCILLAALMFTFPACGEEKPAQSPAVVSSFGESDSSSTSQSADAQESADIMALGTYHKITPEQALSMMQDSSDYILLDVRTQPEFDESYIEGAILIPDYEIAQRAQQELPDKNSLILLYCRSGRRSEAAARKLLELGYTNVYDFGGIIDWPYDTVKH